MTLEELEQVKADVANGVIVSKQTWLNVLEQAIKLQYEYEAEDGMIRRPTE